MMPGGLLDHPEVVATMADPATSYWLRDLLRSAAERDPVDLQAELWHAAKLLDRYVAELLQLDPPCLIDKAVCLDARQPIDALNLAAQSGAA